MPWNPARDERQWVLAISASLAVGLIGTACSVWSVFSDVSWAGAVSMAGLGLAGVGALAAIGSVRRLLNSSRSLRAIDDALAAYAAGERRTDALRIDAAWGERSASWHGILNERDQADQATLDGIVNGLTQKSAGQGSDLRSAFQALPIGVAVLDAQARILELNGSARILLALETVGDDESFAGLTFEAIGAPSELNTAISEVTSGERRQAVVRMSRGEGPARTALHVRVRAMRESGHAAFLLTCEDVTQREIKDESHGIFLSHATHELRTPLTNIRLYAEEAVELGEQDPDLRVRALDVILTETRRLERTVTDMLSASEIESGSLSLRVGPVRLETIFEELQRDFGAIASSRQIDLVFELPPKYPVAQADREKLTLAVHNIVGNALKYTPEGGCVTVRVGATETDLTVMVTDTGIGIAPADQERIFDRFYRAGDERVKDITGTGLGLCLSREIARLHGGEVRLKSELNEGSTFTLEVPIAERRRMAA